MNEVIYSKEELEDRSEAELFAILKQSWGVNDNKIEVWGELPALGDTTFGFLRNPRLVSTGDRLYYPVQGLEIEPCRFFMAPQDASSCGSKKHKRFVRCELELSPESERRKHNNPLSLCVKSGTGEKLLYLPKEIPLEILTNPNSEEEISQFISKSIYDFYHEKAMGDLDELVKKEQSEFELKMAQKERDATQSLEIIKDKIQENEEKRDIAIKLVEKLNSKQIELDKTISKLAQDKATKQTEIQTLVTSYTRIEAEMNNKIKRLKEYVADKALFLKTFEFIDEEVLELFIQESQPSSDQVEGVSFSDILNGDYQQAVSYIQSYLVSQDILYPRHIIENYITLLRTKDLVILAGDSGSGKTNLVKSFAKAVGGKSIIIPVKPNWTSSEDLLGYYNPLEKKYLATPFLEAMIEAEQNPTIPYFICLDEMNLARVEYYFADFLSLLETRDESPEITLYSEDESSHVLSELKAVVDIIQSTKEKYSKEGVISFIELLKDETLNNQLRLAFGFSDKDSLIKYHSEIRRMLSGVMTMPSSIKMPANLHIIGAINIDETTHYLSPKILDRAHIMRFESPLLSNWDEILTQVESYEFEDISKPLLFNIDQLGYRNNYPRFDRDNAFCKLFVELNKDYFHKLGVEFGMRTIRQGLNYLELFQEVNDDSSMAINNFMLHKVLPKFTFDGNKHVGEQTKLELVDRVFVERVKSLLPNFEEYSEVFSAVHAIETVVKNAKANDGVVNFWS